MLLMLPQLKVSDQINIALTTEVVFLDFAHCVGYERGSETKYEIDETP